MTLALPCIGYYAYIEASSPRKRKQSAKLEFKPSLGSGETCISFYYQMLGEGVGTLRVHVNGIVIFEISKEQGSNWKKADLKVEESAKTVSTWLAFIIYREPPQTDI